MGFRVLGHEPRHNSIPVANREPFACTPSSLAGEVRAREWLSDVKGLMTNVKAWRFCERCKKKAWVKLVRNITASGISQIYWLCVSGEHPISNPGSDWISHQKIKDAGYDPNDLPVVKNYSGSNLCAVCGSPFAEYHHWAPHHLFGDEADKWPAAYLCKKHHEQWHALVTPNMTKARPSWKPTKSPSQITH